jgi:8-oxo-dGTP diphosphatase
VVNKKAAGTATWPRGRRRYPRRPILGVGAIILKRDNILLVERGHAPMAGHWSLPGVLVRSEETFDEAARRALRSKAGLDARDWYLEQLATFGRPDRDSRGRVVSVAQRRG